MKASMWIIYMMMCLIGWGWGEGRPVLPVRAKEGDIPRLRAAVAPLLAMSEAQMLALVPEQSGLYFVSCANCTAGQQEGQLSVWEVSQPDIVKCAYCGHAYPSPQYPTTGVLEVKTPRGTIARYPYYEGRPAWWRGAQPYRYYFQARIDYHKIRYMERAAAHLARLYALTKEPQMGRRAALILARFAEVFPGYCYHYDYPFQQKVIYEGEVAPQDFRRGFRTARWTWWAYSDLSDLLVEAYDILAGSEALQAVAQETGREVETEIQNMLIMMAEQVLANNDELSNMSPGMWASLIRAGRVLQRPEWIHECVGRLRRLLREQFFYDGFWMEGTPSYHMQVVGNLRQVYAAAQGYSDPPGYRHPHTGARFDHLDLTQALPEVQRGEAALLRLRLPNGRLAPVHDTWWENKLAPLTVSAPDLLPGLGHAILGAGEGENQIQVHLTWSPNYGHAHWDGLSLLLFAKGQELLSDLGYTHTKWREWTILSPAHNLVVLDGANQQANAQTLGHLRYFTAGPEVQAVSVDNPQVYPERAKMYQRTLALVRLSPQESYVVDIFAVEGGQTQDYFLHGNADVEQTLHAPGLALEALPTLLPEGIEFTPAHSEAEIRSKPWHGYGYLRDLQTARPQAEVTVVDFAPKEVSGAGLQAFLLTAPQDQLVVGRNPAIRQAKGDDSLLENYWRQFVMWRKRGGAAEFAAVLAPYQGTRAVSEVRRLSLPGARLALEVHSGERVDLILWQAELAAGAHWQGQALAGHCELAVLGVQEGRVETAAVIGGEMQWGAFSLQTEPATAEAALRAVQLGATPALVVSGRFPATPGTVVSIQHGGAYTTAYTVKQSVFSPEETQLLLAEEPGFDYNSETQTSTFFTVPGRSFTGPHIVKLISAAHLKRKEP